MDKLNKDKNSLKFKRKFNKNPKHNNKKLLKQKNNKKRKIQSQKKEARKLRKNRKNKPKSQLVNNLKMVEKLILNFFLKLISELAKSFNAGK